MNEIKPKKTKRINKKTLIVAVDIGKTTNEGYYRCPDGTEIKPFTFFNDGHGFNKLFQCIIAAKDRHNLTDIVVGFESTGSYGEPLAHYLKKRNISLLQVNPMHTKRLKELQGNSPNKTDKKDPKVIADIMELGHGLSLVVPEGAAAELRRLIHARERNIKMRTELTNHLEALIASIFPEFLQIMKSLTTKSSFYLLKTHPTPESIVRFGKKRLMDRLHKISRGKLGQDRAEALYSAAKECVGIKEGLESIVFEIKNILDLIDNLNGIIDTIESKLPSYLNQIPYSKFMLSMKGIGNITAAALIGEVGDFQKYEKKSQLIKLAGLNLFELSSGKHKGKKRISKRGRPLMRKFLFFAALNVVRKGGVLHERYQKYLARGMQKIKALVAVSRKLLGIIFALVRDHNNYNIDCCLMNRSSLEKVA